MSREKERFEYYKYRAAYYSYQKLVLSGVHSYHRYITDFISRIDFQEQDNIRANKTQMTSVQKVQIVSLIELLSTNKPLVEKYFKMSTFTLIDLAAMKEEWNKYDPTVKDTVVLEKDPIKLEDLLQLKEPQKIIVLERIDMCLTPGSKGQRVAFMIMGLKELQYINESNLALICRSIKAQYPDKTFSKDMNKGVSIHMQKIKPGTKVEKQYLEMTNKLKID